MGFGSFLGKVGKGLVGGLGGISPLGAGLGIGGTALGALFKHKAQKKAIQAQDQQNENDRNALVSSLNIGNDQREDSRLAHLDFANSILGGINREGAALDPALVQRLGMRRKYDYASAVPKMVKGGAGAGSSLLSGLFGTIGQAGLNMRPKDAGNGDVQADAGTGGLTIEDLLKKGGRGVSYGESGDA